MALLCFVLKEIILLDSSYVSFGLICFIVFILRFHYCSIEINCHK